MTNPNRYSARLAERTKDMSRLLDAFIPRHKAPEGECAYCDRERAARNSFHPPHDASRNCQSGKHNHCSCDTCF